MNTAELIRRKRDGEVLPRSALDAFVAGVASGEVEDAQLGAFLMAVYLRGMSDEEQAALTLAMRDSGAVLAWPDLDGPVLDKHSTGGVGDLVSLVLAPLVAACGGYVPMISGRGLGHTGGTLDKLESIPGFRVQLALGELTDTVRRCGFAMVGQGADLAPADRRMYAVRDVTATVDCRPLVVASILSKKLCEGLDGLVMDIKTGNGAIFDDADQALALGQALCDVAAAAGLPCTALVTDMDQPLARSAGNALELREALAFLRGEPVCDRLREVTCALASELLVSGGLAADADQAGIRLQAALEGGAAAERFQHMVRLQGGPADLVERPDAHLARAPVVRPAPAQRDGVIERIDTRALGELVRDLGGGRLRAGDAIDPAVGLAALREVGDHVEAATPLAEVHAADEAAAGMAVRRLAAAIVIADGEGAPARPAVRKRLAPRVPRQP